jgi:hypothetical protein
MDTSIVPRTPLNPSANEVLGRVARDARVDLEARP